MPLNDVCAVCLMGRRKESDPELVVISRENPKDATVRRSRSDYLRSHNRSEARTHIPALPLISPRCHSYPRAVTHIPALPSCASDDAAGLQLSVPLAARPLSRVQRPQALCRHLPALPAASAQDPRRQVHGNKAAGAGDGDHISYVILSDRFRMET